MSVRGHSRSLKLVPFGSLRVVSYSLSIVTMAVSVAVCEIFSIKNGVTLKTGLRFVQDHWKWDHLIDRIRILISVWRYLVLFARYSELLVENSKIFIPHLYLPRRNFANMFDTHKTRMIGLPCGEK